jgi:hypothetical protein
MSRKKDIERILGLLPGIDVEIAYGRLKKLSAQKLRAQRKRIEWARRPLINGSESFRNFVEKLDEISRQAEELLAHENRRSPHPRQTVQ